MSNVLITDKGMDFVTSAHDQGIYIDVRYFVPVYDDRIDGNVRHSFNLSSFNQIADPDVTTEDVIGEILWRRSNPYTLDISNKYVISAVEFSTEELQGTYQQSIVPTNLHNGTPISNQISATSYEINGSEGIYNFTATDGEGVIGLGNNQPTDGGYFSVEGYHPAYDTSDQQRLRGHFDCMFRNTTMGNFKFNKILLFAVAINKDTNAVVETCLFAETYTSATQIVSNLGAGFDNIQVAVQIDISGVSASFEDLFYSASADYWSHAPAVSGKGLYFDGLIGVNSFEDGQAGIAGVMHLRKKREGVNLPVAEDIPIIRLDYDDNRFVSIDVSANPYDVTLSTSVTANPGRLATDIILGVGGWNSYCGDAIALRPRIKSTIALGTIDFPFRELYLSNDFAEEGTPLKTNNLIPLNVINKQSNYAANINSGQIYLGFSGGLADDWELKATDPYAIRLSGLGIDITDDKETISTNLYGSFKGGDLWRESQNLLIYNTYCKTGGNEYDVENVYMFAGLDLSATYYDNTQSGPPTHKNIIYEIENLSLFEGQSLASTAELHLAARGKIGLHGPIEIHNINSLDNAIVVSKHFIQKFLIGSGILNTTTYDNLTSRMNDLESFADLRSPDASLFLVAANIYVDGNIVPLHNDFNLGDAVLGKRFNQLSVSQIFVGDIDETEKTGFRIGSTTITGEAETGVTHSIIKLDEGTVAQIGQSDDAIDYGFFVSLKANNVNASNAYYEKNRIHPVGHYQTINNTNQLGYWRASGAQESQTPAIKNGGLRIILEGGGLPSPPYFYIRIGRIGHMCHIYGWIVFEADETSINYIAILGRYDKRTEDVNIINARASMTDVNIPGGVRYDMYFRKYNGWDEFDIDDVPMAEGRGIMFFPYTINTDTGTAKIISSVPTLTDGVTYRVNFDFIFEDSNGVYEINDA